MLIVQQVLTIYQQYFSSMRINSSVSFCFVLLLLCSLPFHAFAQVFPVQGNVALSPPYSPYLSDLTAVGAQRFWLQLRLQDPTLSEYTCKLRLSIEGLGITIKTRASFMPAPLVLAGGGVPQTFYGDGLLAYFDPANLDFAGLSRSQFLRTKQLPEGLYRFSIEVLDYNRGTVVSNKISTMAWIMLNDPPMLNLPRANSKITQVEPNNILFSWTGRHRSSPNAAFSTSYVFKLVELPPNTNTQQKDWTAAGNTAFLNQPVLYEFKTEQSQLLYGPAEPALIPGRKYAWQVQAVDEEGRDLFKNQGKSEVYVFQFGDAMGLPENVRQELASANTLSLRWEPPLAGEMPDLYRLRYRVQGSNTWYEQSTINRWLTLGDLQATTSYEVQVRAERGAMLSEYTSILPLATSDINEQAFTCGANENIQSPTNTLPLFQLLPGDLITSRNFTVRVQTATGSNGQFSGTGIMAVPFFNNASIRVKFNGKINQAKELDGEIISTYNAGSTMASVIEEMERIGEDKRAEERNKIDSIAMPVPIIVSGVMDSVWFEEGIIVVLKEDGSEERIPQPVNEKSNKPETVVLTDTAGNSYTVQPNGSIISNGNSTSTVVSADVHYKINFSAGSDQQYGFDERTYDVLNHYVTESVQEEAYVIPWKSVSTGAFDKVQASTTVSRSEFSKEVAFSSSFGDIPKLPGDEQSLQITLQGRSHEMVEEVKAYLTKKDEEGKEMEEVVGRLNVISYNKLYRHLVLVSVNGTPIPVEQNTLQQALNKIYGQAVVQWQVSTQTLAGSIAYDEDNNGLEYGNSGLLSNYTGEMRSIIQAYKDKNRIEDDHYYLFFVPKADDAAVIGYMPRKKQAGFIFSDRINPSNAVKAIAHELAHGAFRLPHVFPELPEQGNNLLDYSATGTQLHKAQWDLVHNPVAVLGLFEGDEEGAMALPCWGWFDDCDDIIAILKGIKARVGLPISTIPLYKPDLAKRRGTKYVGYSIELDGETYSKITILNEIQKDTAINAENYSNYESQEDSKTYLGLIYRLNNESNFKILLSDEDDLETLSLKREKLKNYLFGNSNMKTTDFDFKLYLGNLEKPENSIFYISANPPLMPDIRSAVSSTDTIQLRLKIEFVARKTWTDTQGAHNNELVREDITWFPEGEWKSLNSGEVWDIDFDNLFRGGTAYLLCKLNRSIVDTIVFHIRGENPLEQDVQNYINTIADGDGWYVPKMIRQESTFRQFNTGQVSATNLTAGMPNWGPPYGWGMKQLDNLGAQYGYRTILNGRLVREGGASPDELWNWQLNISKGIQFFNEAKLPVATARWNEATTALALWIRTHPSVAVNVNNMFITSSPVTTEVGSTVTQIRAGNNENFEIIVPNPIGNQRSLVDAHACKFYNGGNNYFTIIIPNNSNRGTPVLPYWSINKLGNGRDYVNDISSREGW